MTSEFLTELSNDYEKLFEKEIGYDVIIYAGEEPNVKEIHAHSNILCITVLGLNIFIPHYLMNGPKRKMESIFSNINIYHSQAINFIIKLDIYLKKKAF